MKYKKLKALILYVVIALIFAMPAYADVCKITDVYMFEGNLYYCDSQSGMVVLRNVQAMSKDDSAKSMAKSLEFIETRLFAKTLYLKDGTQIEYDWLNNYADDKVRFVAVRQEDGALSIMHFCFI